MNVLVTGGAGFIGSHACKALAKAGYQPIAFDNLSRGHAHAVKWGPLIRGNIASAPDLAAALEKYQPVGVVHFAAYAYVGESVENPRLYYQNNVAGSLSLLSALCAFKPVPFVFSSSCATYGVPSKTPIDEVHPQQPINPYGFSKLVVERMIQDFAGRYRFPWIALRYFNAAGCDPDGEIGEEHDPETHLIPLAIKATVGGEPLRIFGTDYETPDGTCIRDFVHVSDLAVAHVAALESLLNGGESCALNLANARGYSVKEVVSTVETVCGRRVPVEIAGRRAGDPPVLVGSAMKARSCLRWVPQRSDLGVQVRDAWNWLRK